MREANRNPPRNSAYRLFYKPAALPATPEKSAKDFLEYAPSALYAGTLSTLKVASTWAQLQSVF